MFKDVIKLIAYTSGTNDRGNVIKTPVSRQVYAQKTSVRQSEFYQAAAQGLRAERMYIVRSADYNEETALQAGERVYKIIRAYDKDGEFTELVCQGMVSGG